MKRVFTDPIPPIDSVFRPDPEEIRHLVQVRRVRRDETLEIVDGKGGLASATVVDVQRRDCQIRVDAVKQAKRESPLRLDLILAIPVQLSTFDHFLPGLVQLGVNRIQLVETEFGGRLKKDWPKYLARLDAIQREALKQSGRLFLPQLAKAEDWASLCDQLDANACFLLFHPDPQNGNGVLPDSESRHLVLAFGPEGGFSEEEVAMAQAAGMRCQSMGPRILRMETAVIGACYWAQARWGDGLT